MIKMTKKGSNIFASFCFKLNSSGAAELMRSFPSHQQNL